MTASILVQLTFSDAETITRKTSPVRRGLFPIIQCFEPLVCLSQDRGDLLTIARFDCELSFLQTSFKEWCG